MKDFRDYLTEFIFQQDTPEKSDFIMIPGSGYGELSIEAARLYNLGYAPKILISGKYSKLIPAFAGAVSPQEYVGRSFPTEAKFHTAVLTDHGVLREAIIQEEEATFTYENALYLRKLLEEHYDFSIEKEYKAILVCQAFHARRSLLYFQYVFPNIQFYCCPAVTQGITRENWYQTEIGLETVLGEINRCAVQFKDILKGSDPVWKEILR